VTTFGPPDSDNRSYRVSFAKIREHLPDYRCEWPAERGADELARLFAWLGMSSETFAAAPFTRLTQLKRLVAAGQIDDDFFWTDAFANAPRPAAREVA
jgi:hypothetical protein